MKDEIQEIQGEKEMSWIILFLVIIIGFLIGVLLSLILIRVLANVRSERDYNKYLREKK